MLGIFALSAALKETDYENYHKALALLEESGIDVQKASNLEKKLEIFDQAQYHSCASVEERLSALKELQTSQYLAMKGGYGVQQCLSKLDKAVFQDSKIFAYSDLTALFLALHKDHSIKLFHSPMLLELPSLSQDELDSFLGFLKEETIDLKTKLLDLTIGLKEKLKQASSVFLEHPSYIWGGNLSLLLSMNQKVQTKNGYKNILFVEDCYEEGYKTERMLYSLKAHGFLDDIDELWLGEAKEALFNIPLLESFAKEYNFKLVTGLPFGHKTKFTLPIFSYFN